MKKRPLAGHGLEKPLSQTTGAVALRQTQGVRRELAARLRSVFDRFGLNETDFANASGLSAHRCSAMFGSTVLSEAECDKIETFLKKYETIR